MAFYFGSAGPDRFDGTFENDTAYGQAGNDTLLGAEGADTLNGEDDDDYLDGGNAGDSLSGGNGNDVIIANTDFTQSNIYLDPTFDVDTLIGGAGNDHLYGGIGDLIDGGDGIDDFSITFLALSTGISVDFSALTFGGTVFVAGGSIQNVDAFASIYGTNYADQIAVGNLSLAAFPLSSDPSGVHGGAGNDTLDSAYGNARLFGDDGSDSLTGNNGNDTLFGGADGDFASGGVDDDVVSGEAGPDTLYGNEGTDTLDGGSEADLLDGGAGADSLSGGSEADTLLAGAGVFGQGPLDSQYLDNSVSADTLGGGTGDDILFAGYGDSVDGGDGTDLISVSFGGATSAVQADFATVFAGGSSTIGGVTYTGLEEYGAIYGSGFGDMIDVTGGVEAPDGYVTATAGEQGVHGRGGDDTLLGGLGANNLYGDDGNDTLDGGGSPGGEPGDVDVLDGGDGLDTVSYVRAEDFVIVSTGSGARDTNGAGLQQFVGIENLIGSVFDDELTGDANANSLAGNDGRDYLFAGLADQSMSFADAYLDNGITADTLDGGAGDDSLFAGYGDSVDGGDGIDILSISFERASFGVFANFDQLFIGGLVNILGGIYQRIDRYGTIYGSALGDYISVAGGGYASDGLTQGGVRGGDGSDTLVGGGGGDWLIGDAGDDFVNVGVPSSHDDTLAGAAGIDTLSYAGTLGVTVSLAITGPQQTGGAGRDSLSGFENLVGTAFADALTGDAGNNVLTGGAGNDTLTGGAGQDTASYAGATSGVSVNLLDTAAQNTIGAGIDQLKQIEHLTGGNFADTLTGSAGNNLLSGGAGDDILDGGAANDTLAGDAGTDTASYLSATAGVKANLAIVVAQGTGGSGSDTLTSIEKLIGSNYNDTLTAAAGGSTLTGGLGNDTLVGGAGNDRFDGGDGNDIVSYANATGAVTVGTDLTVPQYTNSAGMDTLVGIDGLIGSAFADTIYAGIGDNVLDGGAGRDVLTYERATAGVSVDLSLGTQATGGSGTDTISGFEDLLGSIYDDTLAGSSGANLIGGGEGIDTLTYAKAGGGVTLSLATEDPQNTGGAGTDTVGQFENLIGSAFADNLTGTSGANTIEGGAGNDTLAGGAGIDRLSYASATAGIVVNLALTTAQNTSGAGTDTVTGFENLTGSGRSDRLTGSGAANAVDGGAGNDTLTGGDGNDTLTGGAGNDALTGGNGDDFANYADATAGVTVKLSLTAAQDTGGAGTDTLSGVENVTGSIFADTLQGTNANNQLLGGDGDDTLLGGLGNDYLLGAGGRDTASYITATAAVTIDLAISVAQNTGSAGMDRIVQVEDLRGSAYADSLKGNAATNSIVAAEGNDLVYGFAGNDTLTGGTGLDTLYGGDAQDSIQGGDDADTIWGEAGLDNIKGDAGNDTVHGGADNDSINGGTGNDILYGEAGRDILIGDTGADRFVYTTTTESPGTATGRDQIRDFSHAQGDLIDLSAIDAVIGGANNAFAFIGAGAFTGVAGQLNAVLYGSNWIVQGDVNGDKIADLSIQVTSMTTLLAGDFLL